MSSTEFNSVNLVSKERGGNSRSESSSVFFDELKAFNAEINLDSASDFSVVDSCGDSGRGA
jgi:hypothetical protein